MASYELLAALMQDADTGKIADLSRRKEFDLFVRLSALAGGVMGKDLKEFSRDKYRPLVHQPGMDSKYDRYLRDKVQPTWNKIFPETQAWLTGLLQLPQPVFALEFPFCLAKPLLTRDDDVFHPLDNPVRKDHVFKIPLISATSWKGLMRHVLWAKVLEITAPYETAESLSEAESRKALDLLVEIARLFGPLKEAEENEPEKKFGKHFKRLFPLLEGKLQSILAPEAEILPSFTGCLHFYPTHFSRLDLAIINPHDRERRVGKNPILLECVPAGDVGVMRLVYVQVPAWAKNSDKATQLATQDACRVAELLEELLYVRGFSAKRTSGYGLAKKEFPDDRKKGEFFANFYAGAPADKPVFEFHSLTELREQCKQRRMS